MSIVLDGTAGITFPSGSGTQAAQSKVLQVVFSSTTSSVSTTGTAFVTTGLSASITPLFSTSKVLILSNTEFQFTGSGGSNGTGIGIYKNGSQVFSDPTAYSSVYIVTANTNLRTRVPYQYLDSPSTTSSITYAIYFSSWNGQTVTVNSDNQPSSIILMEIAA